MSGRLAKITIIGHVGRDPEIKYTVNGKSFTEFSVAVNVGRRIPNSDQWEDRANWYRVTVWGDAGERLVDRVHKGSFVLVTGSLDVRDYVKDGEKRYSLDVNYASVEVAGPQSTGSAGFEYDDYGRPMTRATPVVVAARPYGQFVAPAGGFGGGAQTHLPDPDDLDDLPF